MLESNIFAGQQEFPKTAERVPLLHHGVSVTDACLGFEDTENILKALAMSNKQVRECVVHALGPCVRSQ